MSEPLVLIDNPAPFVRRLTLNRPHKRNALSNALRGELFAALDAADRDDDVRATILRGAGSCFSAGYDLSGEGGALPYQTAGGAGQWARHVVEGAFRIWDLAKPVIAQVHGWCLAGGSELATACDLVYVAEDAQIGYPPVRMMSPPDNQFHAWLCGLRPAMEMMLTGDAISGVEAVRVGFANRAFAADALDREVLALAERIAKIPTDVQQMNKRSVHRAMEIMGLRAAIRAGTEIQALALTTASSRETFGKVRENLKEGLSARDGAFGDYRTKEQAP
ncbi:MAG: enoyl-CoA hydratase/isomerase family protein [Alphaproteobacteria bacterium]|nr:enoyl-CoA hydratase/isomerase family protein [Alphaproteobacteria bacterium]MBL6940314.1 enoyl-CoA hydratase/isomerase family protein [Alphaproteobacteria bacterium]MBL7098228.1 enoyl-CoA hydratase/isomerase family protein [Alphaproteobacteria bacterium]